MGCLFTTQHGKWENTLAVACPITGPLNSQLTHGYCVPQANMHMKESKNILVALLSCFGFLAFQAFHRLSKLHFQTYFSLLGLPGLPTVFHWTLVHLIPCLFLSKTLLDLFIQKCCLFLSSTLTAFLSMPFTWLYTWSEIRLAYIPKLREL